MTTKYLFIFLFLAAAFTGFSQNYYNITGARQSALGGSGVALTDVFSANNNQAAMAFYDDRWGAGFYYRNSFMARETSLNAGAFVIPAGNGSFGLTVSSFGYSSFNTKKIGLGYGRRFGKRFAAGLQLDYISVYIADNYGKRGLFTFDLSLLSKPVDELSIGFHVFNPIRAGLADYNDERLPVIMNLGAAWQASENLTVVAEAESDVTHPLVLKAGVEYKIIDMVYARLGISNNPNIFTFGAGLHLGNFRLDFSSSMHQVLGYSPQVSLSYDFD